MYLLDTSAILAHCFGEEGAGLVRKILAQKEGFVASVSWFELRVQLQEYPEADEIIRNYETAAASTFAITHEIAAAAFELRRLSGIRIPTVDALIAATAKINGLQLIHRDPHFATIPADLLKQVMLPTKAK